MSASAGAPRLELQRWAYRLPFVISRGELLDQTVLHARAETPWGPVQGEGEPHESDARVAQSQWQRGLLEISRWKDWPTREQLRRILPPDGLRNCLDALLWDLDCKRQARRAWELAGFDDVSEVTQVTTLVTVTLASPEGMAAQARSLQRPAALKIKLGDRSDQGLDRDIERALAVAEAVPGADLVVDANEGWTVDGLQRFVEATGHLRLRLIEQPLPVGQEDRLRGWSGPVPLAADESCTTADSLARLAGCFQCVNIKLDKCGGLTEALDMAALAQRLGFALMVGCNCGTSLAMAPAFVLATRCDWVDLDGPLHLANDRPHPVRYIGSQLVAPPASLWG